MVDVADEFYEQIGHFGHPQVEGTFISTFPKGPKPPFEGFDAISVDTESDVNLCQLADEIHVLNGSPVRCALIPLGEGRQGNRLYITPPVTEELITRAIMAHEPDELYSLTPEQRMRHEMAEKIQSGSDISHEDFLRALGMALRSE